MKTSVIQKLLSLSSSLCLSIALSSCETTGGGRISSTDPEVVKAKAALLASLGDYTVACKWVVATKTSTTGGLVSHDFVTGGTRSLPPLIDSDETKFTHHYSDWKITDDGALRGRVISSGYEHTQRGERGQVVAHDTGGEGGSADDFSIPILKVSRVFVHDRERSNEADESSYAETSRMIGLDEGVFGKDHRQTLSENLTGAAAVEFVLSSRKLMEKYRQIYFPNRQRAQQFLDRWNALIASIRK